MNWSSLIFRIQIAVASYCLGGIKALGYSLAILSAVALIGELLKDWK